MTIFNEIPKQEGHVKKHVTYGNI